MFQNVLESGIPPDVCDTFFSRLFFSISGDSVCYRSAWKNYGVTMSSREESLRISCKHFGFRMSSRLFHECLKTMLSRRSERKDLYGCLGMTYVSADCFRISGNAVCFRTASKNHGVRIVSLFPGRHFASGLLRSLYLFPPPSLYLFPPPTPARPTRSPTPAT